LKSRASQATCVDSSFSSLTTATGKLLSSALVARNADLARALHESFGSGNVDFDTRYTITKAFTDGLWVSCSDAQFAARKTLILDLIGQLGNADFSQKQTIQQQLDAALTSCF
jgi:hypothetical protein